MSKVILPRDELTALVLAEIRKHNGCGAVDAVVVLENTSPRSATNWEIAIVIAGSKPAAAQRASAEVQQRMQMKYQLG